MSLVDQTTDERVAGSIQRRADKRFQEAIKALSQFRCVNLVVDGGAVHHLKTIACFLTNTYHLSSPVLLDLRKNRNFNKQGCAELFGDLLQWVDSYHLILCAIVIDSLRAQSSGLDELLLGTHVSILRIKCFAHMSNLVLANTLSTSSFSVAMPILSDVQCLLRATEATTEVGRHARDSSGHVGFT
jgi:hypothetical protein